MLYIRAETPQTLPRGRGGGVGGNLQGWSGKTRSRFEARRLFYPRYQGRNRRRARCSFVCLSAVIAVCVICSGFRRAAPPRLSHFAGLTREIGVLQPPEAPLGACSASSLQQQQQFFGFVFVKEMAPVPRLRVEGRAACVFIRRRLSFEVQQRRCGALDDARGRTNAGRVSGRRRRCGHNQDGLSH